MMADTLGVTKGAISQTLKRLVDKGFFYPIRVLFRSRRAKRLDLLQ